MSDKSHATRSQKHFGRKKSLSLQKETSMKYFSLSLGYGKNLEMASEVSSGNLVSVLAQNVCWTGQEQRVLLKKDS